MSFLSSPRWGDIRTLLLAALCGAACACEAPERSTTSCEIVPPDGPFDAPLTPAPRAAAQRELPTNSNASTFLISPAPRHRWSPKVGLVETQDGSLLLHGVGRTPGDGPAELRITVLVGYEPVSARLRAWSPDRREKLADVVGTHLSVRLEQSAAAFDVELPRNTISSGHWQEVQTIVTLGAASPDVRRWTAYSGPRAPGSVACVGGAADGQRTSRSRLAEDGSFEIHAPRAATLAVVPVQHRTGKTGARHMLRLAENEGWQARLGPTVSVAAVFDGPLDGPGKNWISNFWSATRAKAVSSSKVR